MLGVDATAQPGGDLAAIEQAIDEEMARFLKDGPTQEEVDRVVTRIRAGQIRGLEQVGGFGGKAQLLARNATYAGDPSFYKVSMRRLTEATPEAIRDAARRWFSAGSLTLEVHPFTEATASATGADRSNGPPMPDSFPDVDFDDFERGFLSNGMELIVANRSAVPVVQFNMLLDAGYAADMYAKLGTSSLTMSMLDEGTKKRTSLEISDSLANLGTNLGTGANLDQSSVSLNTLKENLGPSLEIFADIIMNPVFPESELSRIKKQTAAGIQREQASPFGLAQRLIPGLIYDEDHA